MRTTAAAVGSAALIVTTMTLGGCAIITPTAPVSTPSALESCAMGHTWSLDMAALQEQLVAAYAEEGVPVTEVVVEGSQTLEWTENGHVTIESAYTVNATSGSDVADAPYVITQTITGTTTGRAYFSDVVAIPRDWDDDDLVIEITAVKGAEPLEAPPFGVPKSIIDDTVGLTVVCSPETMTTSPRGSHLTLTWVPAG
jgi:hypothetical protein